MQETFEFAPIKIKKYFHEKNGVLLFSDQTPILCQNCWRSLNRLRQLSLLSRKIKHIFLQVSSIASSTQSTLVFALLSFTNKRRFVFVILFSFGLIYQSLNGAFPSRKCFINEPATWRNFVKMNILMEIYILPSYLDILYNVWKVYN